MMEAFFLERVARVEKDSSPLALREVPRPEPGPGELLLRVESCGVCHTELDEIEGRTPPPVMPVIPGHQVVGTVVGVGEGVSSECDGERRGVAWIFSACGTCAFCLEGRENLCQLFRATGRDRNGGYAEYMVVPELSAYPIPEGISSVDAAPLLCGGAIGYRSLRLTNLQNGQVLGLMGFGASGHLVLKTAKVLYPKSKVIVFARSLAQRKLAMDLGAFWAGDVSTFPPVSPNAIIDTTPAWQTVLSALEVLAFGGRLVINAIRKESADKSVLGNLSYEKHIWLEKEIKSVANITRSDVKDFLHLAATEHLRPQVVKVPFKQANEALVGLKCGGIAGARVLVMDGISG